MGRESRANPRTREAKAKPESARDRRDRLRTTLPNFTRNQMLLYLGLVEGKPGVVPTDKHKEKQD